MIVTETIGAATTASVGNTFATANSWVASSGTTYITASNTSADWAVFEFEFTVAGGAAVGLWVTTDGGGATPGAAVGGYNCLFIPATMSDTTSCGGMGIIPNIQPNPNWNVYNGLARYQNGFTNSGTPKPNGGAGFDQSAAVGWTSQSGMTGTHQWNNAPNWASWVPDGSASAGHVTITFQ
jgi:hypothetical protein